MTQVLDPTVDDSTMSVLPDAGGARVLESAIEGAIESAGRPAGRDAPSGRDGEPDGRTSGQLATEAVAASLLPRSAVQGRYQASTGAWQVDLRVDVDGSRPTGRVSGDFFATSGATTSYFGSFVVDAPQVSATVIRVHARGTGRFTFAAGAPVVEVMVPRVPVGTAPKPATLHFSTDSGTSGATYTCPWTSPFLRTVAWEQDSVAGAVPFVAYDTALLPRPSGIEARTISVAQAYADAGIQLLSSGAPNVLPVSDAGTGTSPKWSDSELHNAMVKHFSLFADLPRWQVWLLVATAHDQGARGIMFDYSDAFQRQGCAVFYDAIKGADPANQRAQLRTYVHELGHAFNLLHSWQKNLATPPAPLGPNGGLGDLSWMNYAWKYQPPPPAAGGEPAYWAAFPFEFTTNELVHLRHGFYRDVVMGANAFAKGAAELAVDPEVFADPIVDNSGLALELRAKPAFAYGEPVVVELKLSATDLRGRTTHGYLHPRDEFVQLAVRQPSGRTVLYRPVLRHCVDEDRRVRLDPGRPAVYDSAYIGSGRDGQLFEQPGRYAVRAVYTADDGSRVLSPILELRIRRPLTEEDERVGDLLLGEEQGQVLALLGSDSDRLTAGTDAVDTVLEEHADHPLAVYARLVKGINAERDFKDLGADGVLRVRSADTAESIKHLTDVAEASTGEGGVDNITLNAAMRTLAEAQAKAGDVDRAKDVMDRMVSVFEDKDLTPPVLQTIRLQAQETLGEIAEMTGEGAEAGPQPIPDPRGGKAGQRRKAERGQSRS
jgi:hypothetical protein